MKKILSALLILSLPLFSNASVGGYSFASSTGVYTPISGTVFYSGAGWDDGSSSLITMPFTFVYNGSNFTSLGINANGFITLGAVPADGYCGLQSSPPNSIAGYGTDLVGASAASSIQYTTIGTAPNRQFVIQWADVDHYGNSNVNHWNFQIVLSEGTNLVQVIFGPCTDVTTMVANTCADSNTESGDVGLLGSSTTDFNIRSVTNGSNTWATSIAGLNLNAVCNMSTTNVPLTGLTYTWTPGPILPMSFVSSTTVFLNPGLGVGQGAATQILQVQINTTNTGTPLTVSSLSLSTAGSSNPPADIVSAKIYYTGISNTFSTSAQFGATVANPNGAYSVNGTATLSEGTNYFWVVYNISPTGIIGDVLSGCCNQITGSGNIGTTIPSVTCPAGTQTIAQVGTWTALTNPCPRASGGLMLLLSDGTVMAKSNSDAGNTGYGNRWNKLTPDIHGSYANGTWSAMASMTNTRLYFSSQVLKDGRVYTAGGEYGTGGSLGEVYNPTTDTWSATANPGQTVSDANSEILPDGRVLQAVVNGSLTHTLIYDPVANTYVNGPTGLGIHNESAWVKLADNSILYVNRLSTASERYIPATNTWVADGTVPVALYDAFGDEAGAGLLLPDGRAFFLGSSGHTAYYTPTGTTAPGTWAAGPDIPANRGTPDAPAAMMVNGKILLTVSPVPTAANHFPSPTYYYEFNYLTNSFTLINTPNGSLSSNNGCYISNMLDLPNGQVLYNDQGRTTYYVYTPAGAPVASGKPVINTITPMSCTTYRITGNLFNGISEGAAYGDDWQMSTNYPIIRMTSGTNVYYAKSYNWNSTGLQRGSAADTAYFNAPVGLPLGSYSTVVTANGISSDPRTMTIIAQPNNWTGDANTAWENPDNWSCGVVADANTDVLIPAGATVIISSAAVCRSITVMPGASVTVRAHFGLTVMH